MSPASWAGDTRARLIPAAARRDARSPRAPGAWETEQAGPEDSWSEEPGLCSARSCSEPSSLPPQTWTVSAPSSSRPLEAHRGTRLLYARGKTRGGVRPPRPSRASGTAPPADVDRCVCPPGPDPSQRRDHAGVPPLFDTLSNYNTPEHPVPCDGTCSKEAVAFSLPWRVRPLSAS